MRFDDLDKIMRTYEESLDQYIEPDKLIIARLDGRCFTRLTKELCDFKKPFVFFTYIISTICCC